MYNKLIQINNPQIFFKYELDALSYEYRKNQKYITNFFTFLDETNKFADKILYIPYELTNDYYWGDNICVMKRCEEERYSQHVIDSCQKDHKKYGTKIYEWHLVKKPAVINTLTGKCVFIAEYEMDYVYVYNNLIYVCSYFGKNKKILNMNGELIYDGFSEMFTTKTHLIIKTNHDYRNNIDNVIIINRKTGEIELKY